MSDLYEDACGALALIERAGGKAMLAGGCVRDRLRGVAPKDYDIATTTLPRETMRIFKRAGFKTVPTGIKHGTITLLADSSAIEITTLRSDIETDGRHVTKLVFSNSFAEDAARRDFTINAMFEDRHGDIHDYFQGRADLQAKRLVFVGKPLQRIREDYLRIMRLFRFQARLAFTPDRAALAAVRASCAELTSISQERITAELLEILSTADISAVLQEMLTCGVLAVVLPESSESLPFTEIERSATLDVRYRWLARLALLLRPLSATALNSTLRRLKLSNQQCQQLRTLLLHIPQIKTLSRCRSAAMALLDNIEHNAPPAAFMQIFHPIWRLWHIDAEFHRQLVFLHDCERQFAELRRRELPLSGTDLMQSLSLKPGRVVGKLLDQLKTSYRDGEWQTRAEGLALARELLARDHRSTR